MRTFVEAREPANPVQSAARRRARAGIDLPHATPTADRDWRVVLSYVRGVAVILQLFYTHMTVICGTSTPLDVPQRNCLCNARDIRSVLRRAPGEAAGSSQ